MLRIMIACIALACVPKFALAETVPFQLLINGAGINVSKGLELSDIGEGKTEINFNFSDDENNAYSFDLKYKSLPNNRSYPANLDVTIKDQHGKKKGYLFFANNNVSSLSKMERFGLIFTVKNQPVDVAFIFKPKILGSIRLSDLENERFIQDTLIATLNFQMIRPVVVPLIAEGMRSKTYDLDSHPFAVNYSIKQLDDNKVEFQHNLYSKADKNNNKLFGRVYFSASNIEIIREAMYAAKFFDDHIGPIKLVFYPAFGQLEPPRHETLDAPTHID